MPEQRFRLVADISSDDPAAIEPPLRQLAPDAFFWANAIVRRGADRVRPARSKGRRSDGRDANCRAEESDRAGALAGEVCLWANPRARWGGAS
jgi:hypothetical protein